MWPFSKKKKTFWISWRRIIIINNSDQDISFLEKAIVAICKNINLAKKFPKITFFIDPPDPTVKYTAFVNSDEMEKGLVIVHLLVDRWISLGKKELIFGLTKVIVHELTHIWHNHTSKLLRKKIREGKRLTMLVERNFRFFTKKEPELVTARQRIQNFIFGVAVEGLARFCDHYLFNLYFDEKTFQGLYQKAEGTAKVAKENFEKFLVLKDLDYAESRKALREMINSLSETMYPIGHHVVYTVYYISGDMTIEKIAKLSPFKLIKEYEKVMKIKGLKPIISLTSGDGILDYKRMVAQWWATTKRRAAINKIKAAA